MNFRTTSLLFGLLLGVLWIFGLILALGKSTLDLGLVFPKLARSTRGEINFVEIVKKDTGKTYIFSKSKDAAGKESWRLKMPPNEQSVRVLDTEVDGLIDDLRGARHSNDETDINRNLNDPRWGLIDPKTIVTVKTDKGDQWQLFVGNERETKDFVYVKSSDRDRDVLAVRRTSMPHVFFDDIDTFRVRKLLEAKDVVAVRRIELRETRDGKTTELILEKGKDKPWWFKKPPLGPADYEGSFAAPPPALDAKVQNIQSVKTLLSTIINLGAANFEAIGSPATVDEKNALLRIELSVESGDDKTEVLLIGNEVENKDAQGKKQYLARLASDNSVVRINADQLEPVFALLKDPKPLRSHDVSQIDAPAVDAVEIWQGKDAVKLFKREANDWQVYPPGEAARKANAAAITESTGLLAAIQGKNEIKDKDFEDLAKIDELKAKFAPEKLNAKIIVWANSLAPEPEKKDKAEDKKADKEPKTEEKKEAKEEKKEPKAEDKKPDAKDQKAEEKKDQKADAKKADAKDQKADAKKADAKDQKADAKKADAKDQKADDKKADQKPGDKEAAPKKDEVKADQATPKFKDGVKPVVTLSFVKLDKDKYLVKREVPDADPIYFQLAASAVDKMVPHDMALSFFDNSLKTFAVPDVTKFELDRAPVKDRDKLTETFLVERPAKEKEKDKDKDKEPEKAKEAGQDKKDAAKDKDQPKQPDKDLVKDKDKDKLPAKDGEKDAAKDKEAQPKSEWKLLEPKEFAGKGDLETGQINAVLFRLSQLQAFRWVQKIGKETLSHYGLDDKSWTIRVKVTAKKQEGEKEEPKPFVLRLGGSSNKDTDKGAVFAYLEGTDYVFLVDSNVDKLLKDAEFRDRHVLKFDAAKVKELRVFITQDKEIRKPAFERDVDKTWKDKKEVLGFKIDSRRIDDLVDKLADLQVVRYLNVKGDPPKDYELGDAAPLKFEIVMDDGKTIHTVTVGAASEKGGPFYAQCSALPGFVFLVGKDPFADLMGKVTYFRKD